MEVENQPIDESLLLNLDGEGEETPEEEFTGEKNYENDEENAIKKQWGTNIIEGG